MTSPATGIQAFVRGYAAGEVDDAAMEAWLRAIYERGMSYDDTYALTMAMVSTGDIIDWTGIEGPIVDKHSTGGVGDAVTLIAVPLAAACGVKVAKLSGRALGHTGGTIDKLECVPGLRTDLAVSEFRAVVERVGCAIAAAGANLVPADKKMYALRHRTGLVASIPLIAASVMSKKIAAGANGIVLDVKFGSGAFTASKGEANELAETMRAIGERAGRRVATLLTNMDAPLADSAGDALELDEALSIMEGRGGSARLREVAVSVAQAMLRVGGVSPGAVRAVDEAAHAGDDVVRAVDDGRALEKFRAMSLAQGGSLDAFDRAWPSGMDVIAPVAGRITRIDARPIGEALADAKRDIAPFEAARLGVRVRRRSGSRVRRGETILTYWLPSFDPRLDDAVSVDSGDREPD